MVDLKMSKKDMKAESSPMADQNPYPYGARLSLDTDELKKLGITAKNLPAVGDEYNVEAVGRVTSVSQDTGRISLSIQLEQMDLENAAEEAGESEAEKRAEDAEAKSVSGKPKAKTLLTSTYRR